MSTWRCDVTGHVTRADGGNKSFCARRSLLLFKDGHSQVEIKKTFNEKFMAQPD